MNNDFLKIDNVTFAASKKSIRLTMFRLILKMKVI